MKRLAITVRGIVQGVGFRPFVFNLARSRGLSGWVTNHADCVRIEVQGPGAQVDQFVAALRHDHPPQASIEELVSTELPCDATLTEFAIHASTEASTPSPTIPADLAICADCRAEITATAQRRYRYPFTNCTNCGPRWSIITGLPYDRPRTSMRDFPLCQACQQEYDNPSDRRFHAQPIACPVCGPQLQLVDRLGNLQASGPSALMAAADAVGSGAILALKGLGGFQLVTDATSQSAVQRLRERKRRPHKPFAVMFVNCAMAEAYCAVSPLAQQHLCSPQAPILLLPQRPEPSAGRPLVSAVAPNNPYVGAMLPSTPLHELLMAEVRRPVICTSGNLAEEPMAIDLAEALSRLGSIADLVLTHNRPIVRPVDDSVAREDAGSLQLLRRARGYAPIPIPLRRPAPCVLAVGGHLKNTVALSMERRVVLSCHVGDLDNHLSLAVHRRAVADLVEFFAAQVQYIACDLHPDYASTQHAEQLATRWNVPLLRIQHHHAHVLSVIAEHQLSGPVLGLSWDGTGYGVDTTIWGGEAIVVDGPQWQRVAHLRTFPLPGGERAAREPRRSALGLLYEFLGPGCQAWAQRWFAPSDTQTLLAALARPGLFPRSSSMGRLFDAVAALCGFDARVSFEGQAAMGLEFAAAPDESSAYRIELPPGGQVADWQPLVEHVLRDLTEGVPREIIAARFHNALAQLALQIARHTGCAQVVLTGGCFQNRVLTDRVRKSLSGAGFAVYTQQKVPPGDGGLALGQILGAVYQVGE